MDSLSAILRPIGHTVLQAVRLCGGLTLSCVALGRAVRRGRLDVQELWRALHLFGNTSLPLTAVTATFMGLTLVLQSAFYVQKFGAQDLIGWFAAYSVMRELGPVVLALMLSGRVGANNTAELATLRATERLDALQMLAVDVHAFLLLPRAVAMMVAQLSLLMVANAIALVAGAVAAKVLLRVSVHAFYASIVQRLSLMDFAFGASKATFFGLVVAVVSNHFGMCYRGHATLVGAAVRQQIVTCALCLFGCDYALSALAHTW